LKKILLITAVTLFISINLSAMFIANINVKGNKNADESIILTASQLHLGDELNQDNLDRAIKNIYKLGFFKDVSIDVVTEDSTECNIDINVSEYPIIKKIDFKGTGPVKKKNLKKDYNIFVGSIASDKNIFHWQNKILKKYRESGFLNATVSIYRTDVNRLKNTCTLKIDILQNNKIVLRGIIFEGNRNISSGKLKSQMQNKPREGIFFWRGKFDEDKFQEDKDKILEYYANNGYPFAKIKNVYKTYDKSGKNMYLHISLDEGDKIYFGQIKIDGNKIFKTDKLISLLKFKTGAKYDKELFEKSLQDIYGVYGDRGYLFLQIVPEKKLVGNRMNIILHLTENFPAHLRYINIAGNTKTHEKVIRREMTIYPGELLKRSRLIETQRKLALLNYFDDLKLDTKVVDDSGDVDLTFKVKEKATETVSGGVAYSQLDGVTGNLSLAFKNLLGTGRQVSLQFDKGRTLNNFQLSFNEPWLFDTRASLGANIFYLTRTIQYSYDSIGIDTTVVDSTIDSTVTDTTHNIVPYDVGEKRKGFSISTGRYFQRFRYLSGYIQYSLQNIDYSSEDTVHVSDYIKSQLGNVWRSSVLLSLLRDSRDDVFSPMSGSRTRFTAEFVGGPLGGGEHFQKYSIDARYYHKLAGITSIMLRGAYGSCFGYKTPGDVPVTEKFLIGGVGDMGLRGYQDRSIGYDNGTGYDYAGRAYFITNVELRFKATDQIYALLFYDMGNVWSSFTDGLHKDFWPMKKGAGIGVRLNIPMLGIIGFDYGLGFDRLGGAQWEPHIQIGTSF